MCRQIAMDEFYDNIKAITSPNSQRNLTSAKVQKEYGALEYKCFSTGQGIVYCAFNSFYTEDVCITSTEKNNYAFFAFNVGASQHMKTFPKNKEIHFAQNLCYCGSMHEGHRGCGTYAKNKRYANHFILLENRLFENFSKDCLCPKEVPDASWHVGDYFSINHTNAISAKQSLLLGDLSQANATHGSLQELYLESKLLELLHVSLQHTCSFDTPQASLDMGSDDIRCLHKAKDILLKNLRHPPSIRELSRKAAINEFKLKKGFKQLFGTTVFGMLQEERLKEAKILLQGDDVCVAEAATLVGYTSLSHFSKIFKEKYGVLPMALKANKKFY